MGVVMDAIRKELLERVKKYPNIARCLEMTIKGGKIELRMPLYENNPRLGYRYTIFGLLLAEEKDYRCAYLLNELETLIGLSGLTDEEIKMRLTDNPFSFESELHFKGWVELQGFKAQMQYQHAGGNIDLVVMGETGNFLVEIITPLPPIEEAEKLNKFGSFISRGKEFVRRTPGLLRGTIKEHGLLSTSDNMPTLILIDGRYWGVDAFIMRYAVRKILKNSEKRDKFTGVIVRIGNQYHLIENADALQEKKMMSEHSEECKKLFSGFDLVRASDLDYPSE